MTFATYTINIKIEGLSSVNNQICIEMRRKMTGNKMYIDDNQKQIISAKGVIIQTESMTNIHPKQRAVFSLYFSDSI